WGVRLLEWFADRQRGGLTSGPCSPANGPAVTRRQLDRGISNGARTRGMQTDVRAPFSLPKSGGCLGYRPASFLHADVLHLHRPELRAQLERRRPLARLRRAGRLAVDLVLDRVALHDDLERVPLAFLHVLVLLRARDDVELG